MIHNYDMYPVVRTLILVGLRSDAGRGFLEYVSF